MKFAENKKSLECYFKLLNNIGLKCLAREHFSKPKVVIVIKLNLIKIGQ